MSGNITIIPPKENYLKVPKGAIFNEEIDTLTLGVYVKVLALGAKWTLNINGLSKTLAVSVAKIRNSFAVLERCGYVRKFRVKGENGQFSGWDYEVYSDPITDISKNRRSENTDIGKNRPSGNGDVYIENNKINRDIKDREYKKYIFRKPSLEEVSEYCLDRRNGIDPQAFLDFYESKGWKVGNTPMKDWRAAIRTWESKRKTQPPTPTSARPLPPSQESLSDYYRKLMDELKLNPDANFLDTPDEQ